jgi:Undecaprenyl-phosphate glucose phosphotransferase
MFDLYSSRRVKSLFNEFISITTSLSIGTSLFIMVLYTIKETDYSRKYIIVFFALCVIFCTAERFAIRYSLRTLRKNGFNQKHIILIGYSPLAIEFINTINKNKYYGYNIIGIVDDNITEGDVTHPIALFGKTSEIENIINLHNSADVIITLPLTEYSKLEKIVSACEKAGVKTSIIPDYYKIIPARPYIDEVDNLPIINVRYIALDNIGSAMLKRIFDIIVSTIAIILFLPFFILIPIIIKITSPGPIIFKQDRIGYNKKKFAMYKFRSMKIQQQNDSNTKWTSENDPRKTAFGNFLRKTSLDEIPQLFNVLKGEMSLIGPRPEREYYVEKFKETIPKYMIKHQVRPGITGWAQVNGWRGDTSIEKRIEYDLYYIENWSFWLDVKIVFFTIVKGFINKNAY